MSDARFIWKVKWMAMASDWMGDTNEEEHCVTLLQRI